MGPSRKLRAEKLNGISDQRNPWVFSLPRALSPPVTTALADNAAAATSVARPTPRSGVVNTHTRQNGGPIRDVAAPVIIRFARRPVDTVRRNSDTRINSETFRSRTVATSRTSGNAVDLCARFRPGRHPTDFKRSLVRIDRGLFYAHVISMKSPMSDW